MRNALSALLLVAALIVASVKFGIDEANAQTEAVSNVRNGLVVFQVKMTGSAVQFPAVPLRNGITCTAKTGNAANIEIGLSNVTTTADGTGPGYILSANTSATFLVQNSNIVYAIGTANDVLSCYGN